MAYAKVRLSDLVTKQLQTWALPDQIQLEVYLYLTRVLPADITHNLLRTSSPFGGMVARCIRRDPYVEGRDHDFAFLIYFGQDEETLHVARGDYQILSS